MKVASIRTTVGVALLGAISFLLMFIEFPVIPIAPFLKIDFSDVPVLIGLLVYGPLGATVITALKCLIHAMAYGMSLPELIGVFSSFLASMTLILPFWLVMKQHYLTLKKRYVLGIVLATISMTVVMSLTNWLVVLPLYMQVLGMKLSIALPKLVLFAVVPFNLIKGVLVGTVFALIANRLQHWLNHQI